MDARYPRSGRAFRGVGQSDGDSGQEKFIDARKESELFDQKNRTTVQRNSDREVVVTRTFDCPARLVFEAWTNPELFKQWWVPKSMGMTLRSCELDVRVGGKYRLVFGDDPSNPMAFFGKYLEVTPYSASGPTRECDAAVTPGRQEWHTIGSARSLRRRMLSRLRHGRADALPRPSSAGNCSSPWVPPPRIVAWLFVLWRPTRPRPSPCTLFTEAVSTEKVGKLLMFGRSAWR